MQMKIIKYMQTQGQRVLPDSLLKSRRLTSKKKRDTALSAEKWLPTISSSSENLSKEGQLFYSVRYKLQCPNLRQYESGAKTHAKDCSALSTDTRSYALLIWSTMGRLMPKLYILFVTHCAWLAAAAKTNVTCTFFCSSNFASPWSGTTAFLPHKGMCACKIQPSPGKLRNHFPMGILSVQDAKDAVQDARQLR